MKIEILPPLPLVAPNLANTLEGYADATQIFVRVNALMSLVSMLGKSEVNLLPYDGPVYVPPQFSFNSLVGAMRSGGSGGPEYGKVMNQSKLAWNTNLSVPEEINPEGLLLGINISQVTSSLRSVRSTGAWARGLDKGAKESLRAAALREPMSFTERFVYNQSLRGKALLQYGS